MQNEQECNCDKLFDYASDLLSETEKSDFELHMNLCPKCKKDYLILKNIIGAVSSIPEIEVPEALKSSVSEALKGVGKSSKIGFDIKQFVKFAAPVAACVAVTIGFFSGGVYNSFSLSNSEISSGVIEKNSVASENTQSTNTNDVVIENEKISEEKTSSYKQHKPKKIEASSENVSNSADTSTNTPADTSADIPAKASVVETEAVAIASLEELDNSGQIPDLLTSESKTSVYARNTAKIPSSCVITTDNPKKLREAMDFEIIDNTAEGFSIKAEDWDLFKNYMAELNTEYYLEYSEDIVYNIDIEIKQSQTDDKEDNE